MMSPVDPHLLEERYKQLETNFKAIVAELKGRPSGPRQQSELEALLSRLDSDLRHALLRAQASNMSSHQRLEERTAILERNFSRVVDLMNDVPAPPRSPALGTPTASGNGGSAFSPPSD